MRRAPCRLGRNPWEMSEPSLSLHLMFMKRFSESHLIPLQAFIAKLNSSRKSPIPKGPDFSDEKNQTKRLFTLFRFFIEKRFDNLCMRRLSLHRLFFIRNILVITFFHMMFIIGFLHPTHVDFADYIMINDATRVIFAQYYSGRFKHGFRRCPRFVNVFCGNILENRQITLDVLI
jgi:hypothetical protein